MKKGDEIILHNLSSYRHCKYLFLKKELCDHAFPLNPSAYYYGTNCRFDLYRKEDLSAAVLSNDEQYLKFPVFDQNVATVNNYVVACKVIFIW